MRGNSKDYQILKNKLQYNWSIRLMSVMMVEVGVTLKEQLYLWEKQSEHISTLSKWVTAGLAVSLLLWLV